MLSNQTKKRSEIFFLQLMNQRIRENKRKLVCDYEIEFNCIILHKMIKIASNQKIFDICVFTQSNNRWLVFDFHRSVSLQVKAALLLSSPLRSRR